MQYSINFTRPGIKFCLSLHYNGSHRFLFVSATKIYQVKAADSEMKKKAQPLCLETISKDFTANKVIKKTELNGYVHEFSLDYNIIDNSTIINIHKY